MSTRSPGWATRLLSLFLVVVVGIVAVLAMKSMGWLSIIGINSETHDSQVIQAIERTEEVSLLKLGIQGILEKEQNTEIGGWGIPLTAEKVFVQYNFSAKLGIDGKNVSITKDGENKYVVSVPEFMFIGYDQPTFKVAVEDGSALSWVTPDIDTLEMANEILGDQAKDKYLADNAEMLKDQTVVFYDGLIKSVAPDAETSYEFSS